MANHELIIRTSDRYVTASIRNLDTGNTNRLFYRFDPARYKDGPKWTGQDEWLGDVWASIRDTYDKV